MAMFENFPYTDLHNLNLDWIIKIAKDFLDQYTHIEELIEQGKVDINELTEQGLETLANKTTELETLLQNWYDSHSSDIADELAAALSDLNDWYEQHEAYLDSILEQNITTFTTEATRIANEVIATIPEDYTTLSDAVETINGTLSGILDNFILNKYFYVPTGEIEDINGWAVMQNIPIIKNSNFEFHETQNFKIQNVLFYDSNNNYLGANNIINTSFNINDYLSEHPTATKININFYSGAAHAALTPEDVSTWYMRISNPLNNENIGEFVTDMTIEDYTRQYENLSGTVKEGYAIAREGEELALSGWNYIKCNVVGGNQYYASGMSGSSVALFYYFDSNDNLVYRDEFSVATETIEYRPTTAPLDAAYVCVNARYFIPSLSVFTAHFVKTDRPIGTETNDNEWKVKAGNYEYLLSLTGTYNETFGLLSLKRNGVVFKDVGDEIAPVNVEPPVRYIGANHGFYMVYYGTANNHGLTVDDIGRRSTVNGETWVLVQVNDANHITMACIDDSVWWGVKTVDNPPMSITFRVTVTFSSIVQKQLYPSVKNIQHSIIKNTTDEFIVAESYGIIDLKSGLNNITNNIGNNNNNSIAFRSDIAITIRTIYTFNKNGALVITNNIKMNDPAVSLYYYAGIQSGSFGSNENFAVPLTNYSIFQPYDGDDYFYRNTWTDQNEPPMIYAQLDNNVASAEKMLVMGVFMEDRNDYLNTGAGFMYRTGKMYPYAVQPEEALPINKTLCFKTCYVPAFLNELSNTIKYVAYWKDNNTYYMYAYNNAAVNGLVNQIPELVGKNVETIFAENTVCNSTIVATNIDIRFNAGGGHILLKLTD